MIDTLKLSKRLQNAGMNGAQADGIAEALSETQSDYLTKKDLDLAVQQLRIEIEKLRSELQRFVFATVILSAIAQIAAVVISHFAR